MIEQKLFNQLWKVASATCGNAYLMQSGAILTNRQYKALSFAEKLEMVLYYRYKDNAVVRI